MRTVAIVCFGFLVFLSACHEKKLFDRVPADESGLHFNNQITESDSINILNFEYLFNGGGVGIGDVNNDGLPDVFFSGSQVPSRLFLNRGNLHFEDVTKAAGLKAPYWSTGVSMVDINADGKLDIYLCTINPHRGGGSPNQLFLNLGPDASGLPHFRDVAPEVGLADKGYSTQAAFFDYDRDGDLDCYLLTNALEQYNRNEPHGQSADGLGRSTDRLYRNDGVEQEAENKKHRAENEGSKFPSLRSASPALHPLPSAPHFTNVSKEEGIQIEGWGLGVAIADFNADGWPDVYCANDFQSSDLLWINEHDKQGRHTGFTNQVSDYMKHGSFNAMGIDMADLNNDGWPELMTLDMMPEDNQRQKSMFSNQNYDRHQLALSMGYQPQYVRNALQLNRGPQPGGGHPVFSEVGQQAGIYATDWSWSTLFADFDNDGWRDVLITNGYPKDITDLDFINYTSQLKQAYFRNDSVNEQKNYQTMLDLIGVKKSNWAFRNRLGDANADRSGLSFDDVTDRWGFRIPSYSNGAAYADLDNDGDLDVVINNINDDAFLYRNTLNDNKSGSPASHFLRVHLKGPTDNLSGFGAKVEVWTRGRLQTTEHTVTRGFVSSVEPTIHFGLGTTTHVDSLKVRWPDGHVSKRTNLPANQMIVIDYRSARDVPIPAALLAEPYFAEITGQRGLTYVHHENEFVDFKQQVLLPQQYSRNGPGLAVGDVDGNDLDDVFVGGASESVGQLFLQTKPGQFIGKPMPKEDSRNWGDDLGALFLDVDADGDLDLYVAVGGNEFAENNERYQDRLYVNDGHGNLTTAPPGSLPGTRASGSCVVAADYDRDGDLDLFVGGRVVPRQYPMPARNYLLRNDSYRNAAGRRNIKFTDVTPTNLRTVGLVCAALWTDPDQDGWPDLFLAGEWMPLTFYPNRKGKLDNYQPVQLPSSTGWWNSLTAGDFDNDGDIDYVAGNAGLNNPFAVTPDQPLEIVAKDFDQNGTLDPILSHYVQGKPYPSAPRDQLADQIPSLKKRFTSYKQYGKLTIHDLVENKDAEGAYRGKATQLSSCYVENKGNGVYDIRPLPALAQIAPVFGMHVEDVDEDGNLDLLLVGNFYATNVLMGRYDAGKGLLLRGNGQGQFSPVPLVKLGLLADRDAKALAVLAAGARERLVLVTNTNDTMQVFRAMPAKGDKQTKSDALSLHPDDVTGLATLTNGKKRRIEFYYGTGYLSQSSRILSTAGLLGPILLINTSGQKRIVAHY